MSNLVLIERHPTWQKITLNRPDRLNAFTQELHKALSEALTEAAAPTCRAVLLTGAGRAFCAGQDLNERYPAILKTTPDLGKSLENFYNPLIRQIKALEKPVICAVNGTAAGAGANLALACDIVLAARSATFIQAFTKLGLGPDSGGSFFLPRLIGEARARALMLLAEPIKAEQAESWGMIWKVLDDTDLLPTAEALAADLAIRPTQALALTKNALNASPTHTLNQQLDLERDNQRTAGQSADYREGVIAYFEKRKAVFTGK